MSATVKTEISSMLYSEFIICTLEVTEKLNLNTYRNAEENQVGMLEWAYCCFEFFIFLFIYFFFL